MDTNLTFLDKLITFNPFGRVANRISIFLLKSPKGLRIYSDPIQFYEESKNQLSYLNEPIIEEIYRNELKKALESPYLYFHENINNTTYVNEAIAELGISERKRNSLPI